MSTLREEVSRLRSKNKLLSSDTSLTDRLLAHELNSKASVLIKRETNLRRLLNSPNLFTPIDCLEMIEVPLAECCNYTSDCTISRSKYKLPKIGEGIFGLLINGVYSIEKLTKITKSSPNTYADTLKLKLRNKNIYYWIWNNYLYISDSNIESISISAYFEEDVPSELNTCDNDNESCSVNPLDLEFKCPGYMIDDVVRLVDLSLRETYFNLVKDDTSNEKDEERRLG